MLAFLEYEEQFGRLWHRLVGERTSWPRFPEAGVDHAELRAALPVFFRGIGGPAGIEVVAGGAARSAHRLRLRQRLGMTDETVPTARLGPERLLLPERIELFADPALNRALYFWLAAFCAMLRLPAEPRPRDPLQADLHTLFQARRTTTAVLAAWPGLRSRYTALRDAFRACRQRRRLPQIEAAVEEVVQVLLGGPPPRMAAARAMLEAVTADRPTLPPLRAPRGYRPFLPVPLWGDVDAEQSLRQRQEGEAAARERAKGSPDTRHRKARPRRLDQAERPDPLLLLNKGEMMLVAEEMVDVNRRREEEEDEDAARGAADGMDELTLAEDGGSVVPRLRLDLDLAPSGLATGALAAPLTYPEWSYRQAAYLPAHCALSVERPPTQDPARHPDAATSARIRRVRRQFEALRPKRQRLRRQQDGSDLDTDALVSALVERAAGGEGSERVYTDIRDRVRELAVLILADRSLSTDAWVAGARVIDIEKEALVILAHGLEALGDAFAIYGFTSSSRRNVMISAVKTFDEAFDEAAAGRIASLEPGHYTRIGAAIRFAADRLALRPERHRLLLLLTDGRPTDVDHYDGRHGIEDTRQAVLEARRQGAVVFAVTVDERAQTYVPYLFGRGGFALLDQPERLPAVLPALYRQLTL